jgi:hypothetical protein
MDGNDAHDPDLRLISLGQVGRHVQGSMGRLSAVICNENLLHPDVPFATAGEPGYGLNLRLSMALG